MENTTKTELKNTLETAAENRDIVVYGLTQNNLKHVTFRIPKEKITVFTGLSGSGKSSIAFDTLAAESQRQMNATYPPFVRSRMPKIPQAGGRTD